MHKNHARASGNNASIITKQLMYVSSCNIGFVRTRFRSRCKNRPLGLRPRGLFLHLDRKLVRTNPMLHAEPYINYYMLVCVYTPPPVGNNYKALRAPLTK